MNHTPATTWLMHWGFSNYRYGFLSAAKQNWRNQREVKTTAWSNESYFVEWFREEVCSENSGRGETSAHSYWDSRAKYFHRFLKFLKFSSYSLQMKERTRAQTISQEGWHLIRGNLNVIPSSFPEDVRINLSYVWVRHRRIDILVNSRSYISSQPNSLIDEETFTVMQTPFFKRHKPLSTIK